MIATAILRAFERTYQAHGSNYDPDTCYEAADEVIAVLLSEFSGLTFKAEFHPHLIGPAVFAVSNQERKP